MTHPPRFQGWRCKEDSMAEHDRLSSLILDHWSRYHPSMLARLKRENQLEKVLEETAEQFTDLLYQLVSVQKMEHNQAWEIAVNQFLLPEESSSTNPSSPPATSALPTLTGSGWEARMKRRKQTSPPSGS
jgi:hypothetical protein